MNGIGVVVVGPESSGSRYVTAVLMAGNQHGAAIAHRSAPYDRRFVPLDEIMGDLDRNDIRVVICSRRGDVLTLSQVRNGHAADTDDALVQIQRSYVWMLGECTRLMLPFLMTSYESFADPVYRLWVATWALDDPDSDAVVGIGFSDGNTRYLEQMWV